MLNWAVKLTAVVAVNMASRDCKDDCGDERHGETKLVDTSYDPQWPSVRLRAARNFGYCIQAGDVHDTSYVPGVAHDTSYGRA